MSRRSGSEGGRNEKRSQETTKTHRIPILSVLELALLVVPGLPVHEKDPEVDDVEVRDGSVEAGGEAPGPAGEGKRREEASGRGKRFSVRFISIREERKEKTRLTP